MIILGIALAAITTFGAIEAIDWLAFAIYNRHGLNVETKKHFGGYFWNDII